MDMSLLKKRCNRYIVSLMLFSALFIGHSLASPIRHIHNPPGHHPGDSTVIEKPYRKGNRLYFTPACPIVAQNFNNAADVNGAKADTSAVGWYLNASAVPNATYFAIKSHRLKAETLGGEGIWYSRVFNISGYTGIQVDAKISSEGTLSSAEYMKVSYILNGGPETLIEKVTGSFGNDSTPTVTSPQLTGNTVQIVVRIYDTTKGNSEYYIEKYDVFKEVGPCTATGITVSASASNSGVLTCTNPSTTLTASTTATGTTTYSWTGPNSFTSTSATPVVSTAGTYTVTATNAAGTATASVTVTANNSAPGAAVSDNPASALLTCSTTSIALTGSSSTSGTTFTWTGPNSFTASGATATATAPGTYTVTATNPSTGCTSTATTTVTQNIAAPASLTASAVNGSTVLTCSTNYVTIEGSSSTAGVTYVWTGPNNYDVASSVTNVFNPGVYTLTATNPANGCTATASLTITQNFTPPANVAISPSLAELTCSNPSATLTGSSSTAGATYAWSGPNSFTATGSTATAIASGSYILTVTNPDNGCTNTTTATISQNFTPPAGVTATNSGPLTCSNTSITLTGNAATANVSYSWTGPNNFASSNATATTTTPGTYTLTVTNAANGCTAMATTVVTQNDTVPSGLTITSNLRSPVLTCSNTNVTLTASSGTSGVTFNWTGPNGALGNSTVITATSAGNYSLLATNPVNGCTATTTTTVSQDTASPVALSIASLPANGVLTCTNTAVTLTGSSSTQGVNYSWTGPNNGTVSVAADTATTPGTYTLTATNPASGCTATAPDTVAPNQPPPPAVTTTSIPSSSQLTCVNSNVAVTASSTTTGASYVWTGPGSFTDSAAVASITTAGTYTLPATNPASGCTASTTVTVVTDTTTPASVTTSATPSTAQITCTHPTVLLTSSTSTTGVSFAWSGPSGFTASGPTATVSAPGIYTVTVKDSASGCTKALPGAVTRNTTVPVGLSASTSDVISCFSPTIDLQGVSTTAGVTYSWTGPGGFTADTSTAETSVPGTYKLTVTNPGNGCAASTQTTALIDTASPAGVSASNNGPLNCITTSVTLTSTSTTAGADFLWITPDYNFISGSTRTVTTPGTYTIQVTDNNNGCSSQATTTVLQTDSGCTNSSAIQSGLRTDSLTMKAPATTDSAATGASNQLLYRAYPNPFSSQAFIEFTAPSAGRVTVDLYNSYGTAVKSLFDAVVSPGQLYKLQVNAGNLSSGTYFCVIHYNGKVHAAKLILMK